MSEGINVGKVSTFGMGQTDYLAQIWQMLLSARNGTFPLKVSGGGGTSGWFAPQMAVKTDVQTIAGDSVTWNTITGLSLSVTTTTATQKVDLLASVMISADGTNFVGIRITRGGTVIWQADAAGNRAQSMWGTGNQAQPMSATVAAFDSPGAAGTYTYQVEVLGENSSNSYINRNQVDPNNIEGPRGGSTLRAQAFEP